MLEIVRVQSEAQLQQVRALSRGYILWLADFDKALGIYDPEVNATYGYVGDEVELPGEYAAPDGFLLLALVDGQPAGCVALKRHSTSVGEMRMLFVPQAFQGQRVGKGLVLALLDEAKKLGCSSLRLETSPLMASAYRLYSALGFQEIPPYHDVEPSLKDIEIFMEKSLV